MITTDAAKRWKCSKKQVEQYCREEMVSADYFEKGGWSIPEGTKRPPFTRFRAVRILRQIGENHQRRDSFYQCPFEEALNYLIEMGFLIGTAADFNNLRISPMGYELIEKEKQARGKKEKKMKISKVKASVGTKNVNLGIEAERE